MEAAATSILKAFLCRSLTFHTAVAMSKRSCVQLHSNGTVSCRVACSLQVRAAFASIWKRIWLITGCVLRCTTSRQSVTCHQSVTGRVGTNYFPPATGPQTALPSACALALSFSLFRSLSFSPSLPLSPSLSPPCVEAACNVEAALPAPVYYI